MRIFMFLVLFLVFTPPALAAEDIYVCPMHPHISGEKGDECPICGMTLVPKIDETPVENGHQDHTGHNADKEDAKPQDQQEAIKGAFSIDPSYVQALGVKAGEVGHHEFGRNIRAFGTLAANTRLEHVVNVRTKGWIVDLEADAVGDTIKKGDLLFTYYSPDLMSAQTDFANARQIGNPEQRLRLYGMTDKAIAAVRKQGSFLEQTPFYAPADGTVTALDVRKGAYLNEGGRVMALQDFSKLWVNVSVPVRDVQFLDVGTPAQITVPETGDTYISQIDFIHPVNDADSRTTTIRFILENPDGELKPGTYVDAVFNAKSQSRLAVPVEAVLHGSEGAYIIEVLGDGRFRSVMVETGITAQGLTEITDGLSHGQQVVISGQFMLDAESSLRGGMAAMGHDHAADDTSGTDDMDAMDMSPKKTEEDQIHEH